MAQQDEGWPLGLQPLNARIELARSANNSGSVSFNTIVTGSPSSSTDFSSSNLDTESTGSFFPDNSTTLGSLMGVSSIVELSRRSLRGAKAEELFKINKRENKFNFISRWLFCLSSRSRNNNPEAKNHKDYAPPSLGQYLAMERRATNENTRIQLNPFTYGPEDELALAETNNIAEPNSLFVNGTIAPPQPQNQSMSMNPKQNNGFGSFAELFSCICGQPAPLANS